MRISSTPYFDYPSFQKFKYNGKELGMVSGLNSYDYGARQYYSVVPAWDRVDQHAEKYYNISPYSYCANNPVNAIDPDGKDNYQLQDDGRLKLLEKTENETHTIYSSYGDGSTNRNSSIGVERKFVDNIIGVSAEGRAPAEFGGEVSTYYMDITKSSNKEMVNNFFKFAADNTSVEWSLVEADSYSAIGTSHSSGDDLSMVYLCYDAKDNGQNVINVTHNHNYDNDIPSYGDVNFAKTVGADFPNAKCHIYDRVKFTTYDGNYSTEPKPAIIIGHCDPSKIKPFIE